MSNTHNHVMSSGVPHGKDVDYLFVCPSAVPHGKDVDYLFVYLMARMLTTCLYAP